MNIITFKLDLRAEIDHKLRSSGQATKPGYLDALLFIDHFQGHPSLYYLSGVGVAMRYFHEK